MGKKSKAPDPPDYSGVAAASQESAELAAAVALEQLDWAKEQYAQDQAVLSRVLDIQLPAMEEQAQIAREERERYQQLYQPLEESLIQEAESYATPERQEFEAARAMQDVSGQFEAQRGNALRNLESYGIDPSQTRHQALDLGTRTAQAAAMAGAGTQSRINTENIGRALRGEAINIGRGLPSNIAQSYAQAVQAGQAANQGAAQATQASTMARGMPANYMQAGNQALNAWSGALNNSYANELSAWNANQMAGQGMWSGLGYITGAALGSPWAGRALGYADGGAVTAPGYGTMGIPAPSGNSSPYAPGSLAFEEGGAIPDYGMDPTDRGDTVPILASENEFVIPADVVKRKGTEFFDKLIDKTRGVDGKETPERKGQALADGGTPSYTGMYGFESQLATPPPMVARPPQPIVMPPIGGSAGDNKRMRLKGMGLPAPKGGSRPEVLAGHGSFGGFADDQGSIPTSSGDTTEDRIQGLGFGPKPTVSREEELQRFVNRDARERARMQQVTRGPGGGRDAWGDLGLGSGLKNPERQRAVELYSGTAVMPGRERSPELQSRFDSLYARLNEMRRKRGLPVREAPTGSAWDRYTADYRSRMRKSPASVARRRIDAYHELHAPTRGRDAYIGNQRKGIPLLNRRRRKKKSRQGATR